MRPHENNHQMAVRWNFRTEGSGRGSSRKAIDRLRNIARGRKETSFKNKKPVQECLADELILASKGDMNSFSVAKKEELERVASSAR